MRKITLGTKAINLQSGDGCKGNISGAQSIRALVDEAYHDLECLFEGKTSQASIPSGFTDLDALTGGLHSGDLIVVAARPSMGKTALATNITCNVAFRNHEPPHIAIFSLEMSAKQWVKRMLVTEAKVDMCKTLTGKFTSKDLKNLAHASELIAESNIHVIGRSPINIEQIIEQCRALKREDRIDLVIIDYIQLISNETKDLAQIPAALKALAEELAIPIIVLSQLRRGIEDRADKRPMLSDIPCFPTLEKYASVVMFLYRHEVYSQQPCDKGVAEIIIAKNRNGAVGSMQLSFDRESCRFENR